MKKLRLCLPLVLCLLLSACGQNPAEARFLAFSEELREAERLDFTARLTCEYPELTADFTLRYAMRPDGETVTVVEPAAIAGVRAHTGEGSRELLYDSLVLDLGEPDGSLSPASALPMLVEALRRGHPDAYWQEDGGDAVRLILDDQLSADVRFSGDAGLPVHAQLISGDRVCVRCEIEDWR